MARSLHQLGAEVFAAMRGPIELVGQRAEIENRNDMDDVAVWLTGTKGVPFEIQTSVDVDTRDNAENLYLGYMAMISSSDPHTLTQANYSYDDQNMRFMVLAVRKRGPIAQAAKIVGGVNVAAGEPGWILRCTWRLVAVPFTPPPPP